MKNSSTITGVVPLRDVAHATGDCLNPMQRAISMFICISSIVSLVFVSTTVMLNAQTQYKDPFVTLAPLAQSNAQIARLTNDEYTVIVWEDERSGTKDIYAQKIEHTTGLALWDPIDGVAVCTAEGVQRNPRAAYDSLGGVIIVWEDFRARQGAPITDTTTSEIYAHRISLTNGLLDGNWSSQPDGVPVCAGTNAIARDVCIVGTTDGAYMAWTDYRNSSGYPHYHNRDVYIQYMLTGTGSYPSGYNWVTNGISVTVPHPCPAWNDTCDQQHPDITLDYAGRTQLRKYGAIVVYEDNRDDPWQIYADNIGADGSNLWRYDLAVAPNATSGGDQLDPRIGSTGSAGMPHLGAVVTWRDDRDWLSTGWDIYAQRITHLGASAWASAGLAVCTAAETQRRQRIAVRDDLAMIVWEDTRDSGTTHIDIYGNAIDATYGTLSWSASTAGLLSDAEHAQRNPEVDITDAAIVVAWEDWRNAEVDAGGDITRVADIYGHALQASDPTQFRWTGDGQPITLAKHDQRLPMVSRDVIVWQDERRQPVSPYQTDQRADTNIFVQKLGDECDLPTEMNWKERYAKWTWGTDADAFRFVVDSLGSTYAVWVENRPDHGGVEAVYAQKLDRDGVPKWRNNGVAVSAYGEVALEPDICVDGEEGAYICWRQDSDEIHIAHLNYLGETVSEVIEQVGGNGPRVVEDDAGGVYLGYNGSGGIELRHYDASLTLSASDVQPTPATAFYDVKLSKDREGGTWFVWHDGTDYYGSYWDGIGALPPSHGALSSQFGGAFISITGDFDLDTDYLEFGHGPLSIEHDGLVSATVRYSANAGQNDIVVARLVNPGTGSVDFQGGFPVSDNANRSSTFNSTDISYTSAIASDSIPDDFTNPDSPIRGGAIVSWTSKYFDTQVQADRFAVLTQRISWDGTPNGSLFYPFDFEPVIDHQLVDEPVSDIAPVFNDDKPYEDGDPRYGVITWNSDNSQGCTDPMAVRVQHVDYSNSNISTCKNWGQRGKDAAPLLLDTYQTHPMVKPPWPLSAVSQPNSAALYWLDTRTGSTCLLSTRVYDDNQTLVWNKDVAPDRYPVVPVTADIGQPYPNPASLSMHAVVQLPVASSAAGTVRIALYDALGRRVGEPRRVQLSSGSGVIPVRLSSFGALRPGVYYCGIQTAGGLQTRQLILLR